MVLCFWVGFGGGCWVFFGSVQVEVRILVPSKARVNTITGGAHSFNGSLESYLVKIDSQSDGLYTDSNVLIPGRLRVS